VVPTAFIIMAYRIDPPISSLSFAPDAEQQMRSVDSKQHVTRWGTPAAASPPVEAGRTHGKTVKEAAGGTTASGARRRRIPNEALRQLFQSGLLPIPLVPLGPLPPVPEVSFLNLP
jgi:hypothetical protein